MNSQFQSGLIISENRHKRFGLLTPGIRALCPVPSSLYDLSSKQRCKMDLTLEKQSEGQVMQRTTSRSASGAARHAYPMPTTIVVTMVHAVVNNQYQL